MENRYELLAVSSDGKEIRGMIVGSGCNLITQAQNFLDSCRVKYPDKPAEYCEVWEEIYRGLKKHLVTVY